MLKGRLRAIRSMLTVTATLLAVALARRMPGERLRRALTVTLRDSDVVSRLQPRNGARRGTSAAFAMASRARCRDGKQVVDRAAITTNP